MFRITYKGHYTSDEQIIRRKSLPENAVEFGKISDLNSEFIRGFFLLLPVLAGMMAAIFLKFRGSAYHLALGFDTLLAVLMGILAVCFLRQVHEVIHALFYPPDAEKEIWKSKEHGAYFVYCEAEMSRNRFVTMALAPVFALGIIPFVLWLLLPQVIPMPYNIAVPLVFWMMTILGMGDAANVYHVLKEVPAHARVFNHGLLRSFYILEPPEGR